MSEGRRPPVDPPRLADALLRRALPAGVLGQSILGDLHQEYRELGEQGSLRFPHLWYWRSTLGLSARYGLSHLGAKLLRPSSGDARVVELTATMTADLRLGLRMLTKTPLLSALAVLTIGLGVGLATQTFSAVYGSILRGLPVPDADRLVYIDENRLQLDIESMEMSIHDFLELRAQQTSFEDVAAFYQGTVNLASDGGLPERFGGAYVSANALTLLDVQPLMGRSFLPGEDAPDAAHVIVLGHHVWMNRFAGDRSILGRSIRVNGEATTIVGVMPSGFRFPFNEDVWLPHHLDAGSLPRGQGEDLDVFARLRAGVSQDAARAELESIAQRLAATFPETNRGVGIGMDRYELRFMPRQIRAITWVMLASTFGVLLIACANVANLLLARVSLRTREVAVRGAMGASRYRVMRLFLAEAFVLAALGGVLGVGLSALGNDLYTKLTMGITKPYWIDVRMDLPPLAFAIIVTALASLAAGVIPAVRASGVKIGETLKDQVRGSSGLRLGRVGTALVVGEIAVSCALLVGAGFMIRSVVNVGSVDLGFEPTNVVTGRIGLFEADYPGREWRDQFFTLLKTRLENEPGVVSAALGTHLPALGSFRYHIAIDGEVYATDGDYPAVHATAVSEDYFRTFGVQPLKGRDFSAFEARAGGDAVVIVNQSFVDRYMAEGEALGRRIRWGLSTSKEPWLTIVGVVPDLHVGGGVGGLGDDRLTRERIYLPRGLHDHRYHSVAILVQAPPEPMVDRLREIVAELDRNLPVYDLALLDTAIQEATWAFRLFGVQFTVFGIMALFLAAVGLYGVMAFSVSQRRREMGIRMALGAERGSIVAMVLRKGAVHLGIGVTLGLAMGAAMSRPMRYVLYGVEVDDPVVYGSIVVTLVIAGLLACFVPARSAVRADPVEAMRSH